MATNYIPVIGLEIHAQLATEAKIFAPDPVAYGAAPNTLVSPITLGHPGALPQLNRRCLDFAMKMGLATHCSIAERCYFARKNYFYPDLPKGYQISQHTTPLCSNGWVEIRLKDGAVKNIRLQRIHIEEDSGKSLHDQDLYDTLIDLNRAGTGLIEIVTEPDIANAQEAMAFITEIRKLVRYLEICDGNMEEGSLRCDANISVMPEGAQQFGTKVEVKNMNSISNVGKAIEYEIQRQIELIERGEQVQQQTRTWDPGTQSTLLLRVKESSDDYRYFPEPDLQPLLVSEDWRRQVQAELPELPDTLFKRFTQEYRLPEFDSLLITEQREFANYYLEMLEHGADFKAASNWVIGPVRSYLNEQALDITAFPIKPRNLAALSRLVLEAKVSHTQAKDELFPLMLEQPEADPLKLAETNGLVMESDTSTLRAWVEEVIAANPQQVETYRGGKVGLMGFFVGQVMKKSGGKANPKEVNVLLAEVLGEPQS